MKKTLLVTSISIIIVCFSGCGKTEVTKDVTNTNREKQLNTVRALANDYKYSEALLLLDSIGMLDKKASSVYWNMQSEKSKIEFEKMLSSNDAGEIFDSISEIEKMYRTKDSEYAVLLDYFSGELLQYIDEDADYFDFYRWELLNDELQKSDDTLDREMADTIGGILARRENKKLLLALEGQWMRTDDTFLSGTIMDISCKNNVRQGILTSTVDNVYGFKNGDLKWKSIKILEKDKFTFEDLSRSVERNNWVMTSDTKKYCNAYAVIDFDNLTLNVVVDGSGAGTYQRWTRVVDNSEKQLSE